MSLRKTARWWIAALLIPAAMAFGMERADFSRYEIILTRKPFGEPPPAAAAPAAAPAQASFIKDIRMLAITESEQFGVQVGFQDLVNKKNYYLKVGESEDGIEVADGDYEKEAALLRKGGQEFWIDMRGQVSSSGGASPGVPLGAGPVPPPGSASVSSVSSSAATSYAERARMRREMLIQKRKEQEAKLGIKEEPAPPPVKPEEL